MKVLHKRNSLLRFLLLIAINVGVGTCAPFWNFFGLGGNNNKEYEQLTPADRRSTGGIPTPIRRGHKGLKHGAKYPPEEFDTYYVRIPPSGYVENYNKPLYDHSDGVDVWELPKVWDGNFVVPNLIPTRDEKGDYGHHYDADKRVVKGWDKRFGIRLAIPYIGDFQYLRELGPGDFVAELGPGRFNYPGPSEVDKPGHKSYFKYKDVKDPDPYVPTIDLTHYSGLANYPWFSR